MLITLGKWRPDVVPFELPAGDLLKAENVLPYDNGKYMPALAKASYSTSAMTGVPLCAYEFRNNAGDRYVIVGTKNKLWRMELNKSMTDITRASGGDYSADDNPPSMTKYGEWVIATDYVDDPQVLKGLTTANFVPLGGSPPKAKFCMVFNGHLILAYINDGTVYPNKLVWSALESVEDFSPSLTTGADSQDLAEADGDITGMAHMGRMFAVFHENSITIGQYTGAPYTFAFDSNTIRNVGCIAHGSIIVANNTAYFWGKDNIYALNGSNVMPLGTDIRETVIGTLNDATRFRITSAHDAQNGIIYWAYPTTASTDGTPDKILCFNYRTSSFTQLDVATYCVFGMHTGGVDMDSIDDVYPDMDDMPWHLDSAAYKAGSPAISCVDTDTIKVATFTGSALTGVIETGEMSQDDSVFSVVKVRPKVSMSTGTVSVRIGARFKESESVSYSASSNVGSNGYADLRKKGRFLRAEVTTGQHSGQTAIEIFGGITSRR